MEKLDTLELYNDDCFNIFPELEEKSINLFVLDLPYNQTACSWDKDIIPLDKMWEHIKRIMKPNGIIIMFCTAKFGYRLIHSNPKWFRYDLIWKKSRKVGFLSANKMPLRQHENLYVFSDNHITHCKNGKYGTYNPQKTEGKPYKVKGGKSKNVDGSLSRGHEVISNPIDNKGDRHPTSIIDHENLYVFSDACNDDLDISRNKDLRQYAQKVKDYIGKSLKQIDKDIGNQGIHHFYCITSSQFGIPTETTYNKLIELYKLDEMPEFIPYETLNKIWIEHNVTTYNPQKTEGKPYSNGGIQKKSVYGEGQGYKGNKKGVTERHPTSIIEHENLYVFSDACNDDLDISRNKDLRAYAQKVKDYIGKSKTEIIKDIGQTIDHFFRIKSSQFGIPTEETYNKLIELYELDKMPDFIPYETLKEMWEKEPETTYNPQKTEGKPYKTNDKKDLEKTIYGSFKLNPTENKGDRHPTSIIEHENLYVFSNDVNEDYNDLEISRNKDLRAYAQKVKDYIGKSKTEIVKDIGQTAYHFFFRITSSQFRIPTETTYNKLIELYELDKMPDFIPYETLKGMVDKPPPKIETTYNSQKTEGTPYKTKEASLTNSYYRGGEKEYKTKSTENKGDRHPTSLIDYDGDSILIYKNPHKTIHRTQKPVELLEWLIKTYSNEEETVMDFTMGSGTAAIACLNTNRKFIGVEKNREIFQKAENRIAEHIMK